MSALSCRGCGRAIAPDAPSPYRCPAAGEGGADHVVARTIDGDLPFPDDDEPNPFVRFRSLTHAHARATARGMRDDAFVALVRRLDAAVARVWGEGFVATPFARQARLSQALGFGASGGVWVKDETGNVS